MSDLARMPMRTPPLPSGSVGVRASGWWGIIFVAMSEASVFDYRFLAYFYYAAHVAYRPWPPYGAPSLTFPIPQTALIFTAAAVMWWSNRRAAISVRWLPVLGLLLTLLCGIGFILLGLKDWSSKPFALSSTAYSSLYFVLTGVHLIHTAIGVLMSAAVMVWSAMGYLGPVRHVPSP